MGRRVISIEQILQEGKTHKSKDEIEKRQKQEEVLKQLQKDKIKPPTYLGKTAKKIFKEVVSELAAIDLLANVDIYNLTILSDAMETWIDVTQRLRADDILVAFTNKNGSTSMQKNPLLNIKTEHADIVRKISNDFGLTPSARLKIIQQNSPDLSDEEKALQDDFADI